MKIKESNDFEACPEFTGKGVCVDVTPLRKQQSQYGERNVFKIVFEVDADKKDGGRYGVWSNNFTPTLNEKASLRKFLRGWFGQYGHGPRLVNLYGLTETSVIVTYREMTTADLGRPGSFIASYQVWFCVCGGFVGRIIVVV